MKTIKDNRNHGLPLQELTAMRYTFFCGAGALILVGVIYSLVTGSLDYRIFTGIISGAVISAVNFYLLAYSTGKLLGRKNPAKARALAVIWFSARFFGMAAVFVILLYFNLANIFTALVPLFFPRIHYTIAAFRNKI